MIRLLPQLMNLRVISMLQLWNEVKHIPLRDIDDNDFMGIMEKAGVPLEKQGVMLRVFQELRVLLLSADIDTWAETVTDEKLVTFFNLLVGALSRARSIDPSGSEPGTGLLLEQLVDNNNKNKDNNNNNNDNPISDFHNGEYGWSFNN